MDIKDVEDKRQELLGLPDKIRVAVRAFAEAKAKHTNQYAIKHLSLKTTHTTEKIRTIDMRCDADIDLYNLEMNKAIAEGEKEWALHRFKAVQSDLSYEKGSHEATGN